MKKQYIFFAILGLLGSGLTVNAQTKIKDGTVLGTSLLPESNAILELESTNKGLLLSRVALDSTSLSTPLSEHVAGMLVYNTNTNADVTPGIYFNDGTKWIKTTPQYQEPWNIQSTIFPADSNQQNIYQMGSVAVGKDTAVNNAMLDVNGAMRAGYASLGNVGSNSFASGDSTTASGSNAVALGWHNEASGLNAVVWGGQPTHGVVDSQRYNVASGTAATSWGYGNRSTNFGTTTWGTGNIATNPQATAFGARNQSTGFWSTSFGQRNKASGNNALAFGTDNVASNHASVAYGNYNRAEGRFSTVWGQYNVAKTLHETVFGRYNSDTSSSTSTNWVTSDALLQVGNGTSATNRSNALTILKNGLTSLGTHTSKPHSTLQVNGSVAGSIRSVTASTTLTDSDYTIISRNTGAITITLPDPTTCAGRMYYIINNGTANITTNYAFEVSAGQTQNLIQPASVGIGALVPNFGQKYLLQSDGTVWVLISLG